MITEKSYLEAKKLVAEYESEQLNKHIVSGSLTQCTNCKKTNEIDISILKPPAFIKRTCRYCGYDR